VGLESQLLLLTNVKRRSWFCTLNLCSQEPTREQPALALGPTRKRLAEGWAYLEKLDWERAQGRNPFFGRLMEQRIIRRELIELERQAAREQIVGISAAAGEDPD
jgi:hypothetical protein